VVPLLLGAKDFPRMLETILVEDEKTLSCSAAGADGRHHLPAHRKADTLEFAIVRNDSIGIAFGGHDRRAIPPSRRCRAGRFPATGAPEPEQRRHLRGSR
jgi:hypothetical protein